MKNMNLVDKKFFSFEVYTCIHCSRNVLIQI